MPEEAGATVEIRQEIERAASERARDKAGNARWDLNVVIFLFAILILVIILVTYTKIGIEAVAPIAIFGLAMVWLVGWRRGRQLYRRFYDEELSKLEREYKKAAQTVEASLEETVEEKVQKALRDRWR
jgi:Flp pilus assembly protein TadB